MTITTVRGPVQPLDFAACTTGGPVGLAIEVGEWLAQPGNPIKRSLINWEHAFTYLGDITYRGKKIEDAIFQAEPGGAQICTLNHDPNDCIWSTTNPKLDLTASQRSLGLSVAYSLAGVGVPYSDADYFAIALHRFGVNTKRLENYIASSGHMICSQLTDYIRQRISFKLFDDGRWNGFVMPVDIANVIQ